MNAQCRDGQWCREGNPYDRLGAMDTSAPRCCVYCLERGRRNRHLLLIQPLWAVPADSLLHVQLQVPFWVQRQIKCFLWPVVVMGFLPCRFAGTWYFSLHCNLSQWGCWESPLSRLHLPIFIVSKRFNLWDLYASFGWNWRKIWIDACQ